MSIIKIFVKNAAKNTISNNGMSNMKNLATELRGLLLLDVNVCFNVFDILINNF